MGNVVQNVTAKTSSSELQVFNNQEHQRVYDPSLHVVMTELLAEIKKINQQLSLITEVEL